MSNQAKLLTLKDLSTALGKSENSIRYHLKMGRIKPTVRFGRVYGFNLEQVMLQLKKAVPAN